MATDDLILVDSCIPTYEALKKAIFNDVVLITGPQSVGKRTITQKVFQENKSLLHAYINCYSITTPGKFYATICREFQSKMNIRRHEMGKVKLPEIGKLVSCHEFDVYFKEYLGFARKRNIERLYVVLDHVEVFQKTNLMNCFTALTTIKELNIVIITYELPIDIVHYAMRVSKTAGLKFQDKIMTVIAQPWSCKDVIKWILMYPPNVEVKLYERFVQNVVRIAYMHDNKNPTQTMLYCQDQFENFLAYYHAATREQPKEQSKSGDDNAKDNSKKQEFSNNVVGAFLKSLRSTVENDRRRTNVWTASDKEIKLPHNTATLLVAAYFAAFTKPSDDKKNFVRFQKRNQRKAKSSFDGISRPFTLERLYHIYRALQQTTQGQDANHSIFDNGSVLGDVERFESLNILIHIGGWSVHPEAKFKLSPKINRDYVARLAKNIELDLDKFNGLS